MRPWLVMVAACGQAAKPAPLPAPSTPKPTPAAIAIKPCEPHEFRYALVGSLYTPVDNVTAAELAAAWQGGKIAATAETRAALGLAGGVDLVGERPDLAPMKWAIVPAHELAPTLHVITVDGKHPLDADASGPLTVMQCGPANIDVGKVTTIAMTGTSALTRFIGMLIDKHDPAYVTKEVEPWLRTADFVHISHEVSLVPDCDPAKTLDHSFCGREKYIEALEATHAKIIELTGSHLQDKGRKWIDHTLDMYEERGWIWFGGGRNQADGSTPKIVEHHGNKIAFLGCNWPWTQAKFIVEGPGVAACDFERMKSQIADLRARGVLPIVSIQHQEVYDHEPPNSTVHDFRQLAESGAAVVFGSQAHSAHPWDVHYGAYVHYGAGNFLFDQQMKVTRDGVHDKLYIYEGRLLTVGHLFTRIEEWGKPRPMNDEERAAFVAELAGVRKKLKATKPWDEPHLVDTKQRIDSVLVGKELQRVIVTPPTNIDDNKRYPLVIDFDGGTVDDTIFVAHVKSKLQTVAAAATAYLEAKYPIDAAQVTVRTSKR